MKSFVFVFTEQNTIVLEVTVNVFITCTDLRFDMQSPTYGRATYLFRIANGSTVQEQLGHIAAVMGASEAMTIRLQQCSC